jgi:RHS repeat-associated protein
VDLVIHPNGTKTENTYDVLGQLKSVTHETATDALFASYEYTRDAVGRIKEVDESDAGGVTGHEYYDYDNLGRLKQESYDGTAAGSDYTTIYGLDVVGNRLSKQTTFEDGRVELTTGQFDSRDQLRHEALYVNGVQSTTTCYDYDANGSLISRNSSDESSAVYHWSLRNRLSGATITHTENGVLIVEDTAYQYNDDGIRVRSTETRTAGGGTPTTTEKLLLIDDNNPTGYAQVVEESLPSGLLLASFVYGLEPLSQSQAGTVTHYLLDGHSGVRLLTNAAGAITDRYSYDAFGGLLSASGPTANPLLYRGERFDPVLGQYYLRARFYDPATGRFTRSDPFPGAPSMPGSLHRYVYGLNNPVTNQDPSGLESFGEIISTIRIGLSNLASWGGAVIRAGLLGLRRVVFWTGFQLGQLMLNLWTQFTNFCAVAYARTFQAAIWYISHQEGIIQVAEALGVAGYLIGEGMESLGNFVERWDDNRQAVVGGGTAAGTELERIANPNLGATFPQFDDFDSTNGQATSIKAHAVKDLKALQHDINADLRQLNLHRGDENWVHEGVDKNGVTQQVPERRISVRNLLVAIPREDQKRITPSFLTWLATRAREARVNIVLQTVRSWRRR